MTPRNPPVALNRQYRGQLQPDVALAARQHNRVARRQLRDLDIGDDAIDYRLASGRYVPVDHGVMSIGPPLDSKWARWMTAVLVSREDAVLSYRSGAELHHLRVRRGPKIEVTVPRKVRSRKDIERHYGELAPEEKTVRFGVPTATMQRVVFDLASVLER